MDPYSENHGLVFRSFVYLFKVLQQHDKCNFVLKASFLEIYNEKVGVRFEMINTQALNKWSKCNYFARVKFHTKKQQVIDLLNPGTSRKPLAVRWSKKTRGFFVENLFTVECEELDDLLAVLEEGKKKKTKQFFQRKKTTYNSKNIFAVPCSSSPLNYKILVNGFFFFINLLVNL